jgi:hypothetical protein
LLLIYKRGLPKSREKNLSHISTNFKDNSTDGGINPEGALFVFPYVGVSNYNSCLRIVSAITCVSAPGVGGRLAAQGRPDVCLRALEDLRE